MIVNEEFIEYMNKTIEELECDDIGKPIKSKVDYFPSHKGCKDFEWD